MKRYRKEKRPFSLWTDSHTAEGGFFVRVEQFMKAGRKKQFKEFIASSGIFSSGLDTVRQAVQRHSSSWREHVPEWNLKSTKKHSFEWKKTFSFLRKKGKKRNIFFLGMGVSILLVGLLGIIAHNRKTFVSEPEFRRTILGDWDYTSPTNQAGLTTRLKKETNAVSVQVERENSQIQFSLPLNDPSLSVEKNKASSFNAEKNVEVQYEIYPTKLKESIILHSPNASYEFTSTLLVQNLSVKLNSENLPFFFDSTGKYQFHIERPFAVDAAGNKTFDVKYLLRPKTTSMNENPFLQKGNYGNNLLKLETLRDIEVNTNEYDLVVSVNPQWLLDPQRVYPILIDPTVIHDSSASFAVGTFNRVQDTGAGSSPVLQNYSQELSADAQTMALWHFNETSGSSVADSSGKGSTGTATGTTVVDGRLGKARSFNGTSDYILVPAGSGSPLDKDSNPITMEAWIFPSNLSGTKSIISRGQNGNQGYGLRLIDNKVNLGSHGGSNFSGTTNLTANTWYHVVGVVDGANSRIYLNGQLEASGTVNIVASDLNLHIGAAWDGSTRTYFFNGLIDEVRISGVIRTAEEIAASASLRPYAVYTSPVIDLGTNPLELSAFQKIYWTENGVKTDTPEAPFSSDGLVAAWNFNELADRTAGAGNGSCGSACNGTLVNFAGTAGADLFPASGWISSSAWGAGALSFDGTDDRVTMGDPTALNFTGSWSLGVWVKTTQTPAASNYPAIAGKGWLQAGTNGYGLYLNGDDVGKVVCQARNDSTTSVASGERINDGTWHFVVCTRNQDTNVTSIYVDGRLINSHTQALAAGFSSTRPFSLGMRSSDTGTTWAFPFQGSIDAVSAYSRVLSDAEVLSLYQATNIQFQTRGGNTTTPNDGSWENWKPAHEAAVKNFDDPFLWNTTDPNLFAYWPMDETADNTCTGGVNDICDTQILNDLVVNGTGARIVDGKFAKGRFLPGGTITDYFSKSSISNFPSTAITTEFWVKTTDSTDGLISYASTASDNDWLIYDSANLKIYRGSTPVTTNVAVNDGLWHHVAVTWDSSNGNVQLYKDGVLMFTDSLGTGTSITDGGTLMIGQEQDSLGGGLDAAQAFGGIIDEVKIYRSVLPKETIFRHFLEGANNSEFVHTSSDADIKQEGARAQKIALGERPVGGTGLIARWRFEETSGTSDYLKDTSTFASSHGTPVGTTSVKGVFGKARSFNGTSDYILVPAGSGSPLDKDSNPITMEAWIFPSNLSGTKSIISRGQNGNQGYGLRLIDNKVNLGSHGGSNFSGTTNLSANTWYHVVGVVDGANSRIYLNGQLEASGTVNVVASDLNLHIGAAWDGSTRTYFFNGLIDEVGIWNAALSASAVNEFYLAGRDVVLNYPLPASLDLADKNTYLFSVAADRPGTYLTALFGESAYANYQPDMYTVGLWRLDENTGSGAYIRDSSAYRNHGTPSGTTALQGKVGLGRNFNGTSDYIEIPENNILDPAVITIEAWIRPATIQSGNIVDKGGNNGYRFRIQSTNGVLQFLDRGATNFIVTASNVVKSGEWTHAVAVGDSTGLKIYVNGSLAAWNSVPYGSPDTASTLLLGSYVTKAAEMFSGTIDEVRISNIARTPEEIRQAYEAGRRAHPITIDFAASLDAANLISNSGDTSFTVNAQTYGLTSKGSSLFPGDTVVVKENVNGTEYKAQGVVDSITDSSGATTVASWNGSSTFPPSGFTAAADVFKWQTERVDVSFAPASDRNSISLFSLRVTDGIEGRNVWLDDARATGPYLTTPLGSSIATTTGYRYVQYRTLFTTTDRLVSGSLSLVGLGSFGGGDAAGAGNCYLEEDPHDEHLTLHWTDNAVDEIRYEIQKRVNGAEWQPLYLTSPNARSYSDSDVAQGNTYQYRVRKMIDDQGTGEWCATSVADLGVGSFMMEGLRLEGVRID